MIPSDIVEDILQRSSITDLISQFVVLKRSGHNYKGLCPFHNDKNNPSLSVSEEKGLYHCFSCGAGGNALTFVKEYHKLDFVESIKALAEFIGVDLSQYLEDSSTLPLQNKIKEMHLLAQDFFISQLFNEQNKAALTAVSILKQRRFDKKSIHRFGLGFGGSDSKGLFHFLLKEGFKKNEILESGLCGEDPQKKIYDRFRNRITFPISNNSGIPIAFGGRAINKSSPSKYINSPETILFKKKSHLYGWDLAKDAVYEGGRILIVEGYIDVIRLFQAGFPFAVAPLGTGLTEHHMSFLKNKIDQAYFCLDGDPSGQKSAYRCAGIAAKNNINSKIVKIPENHDPDSFLLEHGVEAFSSLLEQSISSEEFVLNKAESFLPNVLLFLQNTFEYALNLEGEDSSISLSILTQSFLKKACLLADVSYLSVEQDFLCYKESQKKHGEHKKNNDLKKSTSIHEENALDLLSALAIFPEFLEEIHAILLPAEMPSENSRQMFLHILENAGDSKSFLFKYFENPDIATKMSQWLEKLKPRELRNDALSMEAVALQQKKSDILYELKNYAILMEATALQQKKSDILRELKNYAILIKVAALQQKKSDILEEIKKMSDGIETSNFQISLTDIQEKISELKQNLYYL